MPANAGRVRMPANNRVHSSAALQTHAIWQDIIRYDPYAPTTKVDSKAASHSKSQGASTNCGRVGHLRFQCRNFLSVKDDNKDKDPGAIRADIMAGLEKIKGSAEKMNGKTAGQSLEESSEVDDEEDSRYRLRKIKQWPMRSNDWLNVTKDVSGMPATAGRVRMPANNRVHSSAALQTHGIWQSAIGYDPYAPTKDDSKAASHSKSEAEPDNAYASFQGLLALARITGSSADEARGACKKCGRVGHLTFQCRNFLSVKGDDKEKDPDVMQADIMAGLGKIKGSARKMNGKNAGESSEESSEVDDETESSDSSEDSEMERIIAERYGKKGGSKSKSVKKKKDLSDNEDSDSGGRKKRGRSKKRGSKKRSGSDSDEEDGARRKRNKERRRKRDESSDDDEEEHRRRRRKSRKEKRRRRSHRHSDDSEDSEESPRRHKRKTRRARSCSDSDISDSDDSRVGRDSKRSDKKSRKRNHEDDD
ncbi:hypothetical protein Cgig2_003942 [Carnegiea gigantea]|uniref:CCHC-type domain-containing protein n=1 Tax=Carnegiea gigantea TaxID=171969 RepID=A0A9Q1QFP8_9CARY|nr:hypothetical protein Cgig2_003942 [Carnegiea gigantea]